MSELIYKLGVLAGLATLLLTTLYNLPDAEPLPAGISTGLAWLFEKMYFFDPIFDVGVFFDVMYVALIGIATFVTLLMIRWVVLLVLRTLG